MFRRVRSACTGFTLGLLAAVGVASPSAHAGILTFTDLFDPDPNVPLTGGMLSFSHDIIGAGYDPSTDTVLSASLTLGFIEPATVGGIPAPNDDTVAVQGDGRFLGQVVDNNGAFDLTLDGTVPAFPADLQDGGLAMLLTGSPNTFFDFSELTVEVQRGGPPIDPTTPPTPPPPLPPTEVASETITGGGLLGDLGLGIVHDLRDDGFDPATDVILEAVLELVFQEPLIFGFPAGTDDTVSVTADGVPLGEIPDGSSGFASDVEGALSPSLASLQDGVLNLLFQGTPDTALTESRLTLTFRSTVTSVPEPGGLVVLVGGLAAFSLARRRRD